ncbi:hypothetical protein HSBAA_57900 [Vreelandella sulfidaeris]|uniref:Uncharacterized protein n=1 Tax=Vreelandella sulfidaeris TaxID=115553 RepID=A0A455UNF3_9GAMM|nr:hypothetical protein HSBAA_57900 [Halomonas sulfidaeris]
MAGGWTKDGAEQEQMESTLEDAVQRARSQLLLEKALKSVRSVATPFLNRAEKRFLAFGSV